MVDTLNAMPLHFLRMIIPLPGRAFGNGGQKIGPALKLQLRRQRRGQMRFAKRKTITPPPRPDVDLSPQRLAAYKLL